MSNTTTVSNLCHIIHVTQVLDHAHAGLLAALRAARAVCRELPLDESNAVEFYTRAPSDMSVRELYEGMVAGLLHVPPAAVARMGIDWSVCYPLHPKARLPAMSDREIVRHFAARLRSGAIRLHPRPLLRRAV